MDEVRLELPRAFGGYQTFRVMRDLIAKTRELADAERDAERAHADARILFGSVLIEIQGQLAYGDWQTFVVGLNASGKTVAAVMRQAQRDMARSRDLAAPDGTLDAEKVRDVQRRRRDEGWRGKLLDADPATLSPRQLDILLGRVPDDGQLAPPTDRTKPDLRHSVSPVCQGIDRVRGGSGGPSLMDFDPTVFPMRPPAGSETPPAGGLPVNGSVGAPDALAGSDRESDGDLGAKRPLAPHGQDARATDRRPVLVGTQLGMDELYETFDDAEAALEVARGRVADLPDPDRAGWPAALDQVISLSSSGTAPNMSRAVPPSGRAASAVPAARGGGGGGGGGGEAVAARVAPKG